ncbi:MAG: four helix bundle protein [Spirosomaceae bacterium]|nr:four helix bundle protein [Spirosomataceae bacterium]
MATITKFEDLTIWKEARIYCQKVHFITEIEPFKRDYKFKNQIESSSGSIMDNIAEGFGRGGKKEFHQFLSIANGSCSESKSQLYRALDFEYLNQEHFEELKTMNEDIHKMINGLMKYLRNSDNKGTKYN